MAESVGGADAAQQQQYVENMAATILSTHMMKVVQEIAQEIKKDDTA